MFSNIKNMIKKQAKNRDIRAVNRDVSEIWTKSEKYVNYWQKRLVALGKKENVRGQLLNNAQNVRFRINWAKQNAEMRFIEMREIMKRRRTIPVDDGKEREVKKRPPENSKRKHTRTKNKQPKPSPRPDTTPRRKQVKKHPTPPTIESRTDVIPVQYDSKIGYFTSLNNIEYFSEEPIFNDMSKIDIDLREEESNTLTLRPGESWQSEWYETSIIRGMDINVIGTHRLNYLSNGDFEL